jgi:hypothetical protein
LNTGAGRNILALRVAVRQILIGSMSLPLGKHTSMVHGLGPSTPLL